MKKHAGSYDSPMDDDRSIVVQYGTYLYGPEKAGCFFRPLERISEYDSQMLDVEKITA